MTTGLTTDTAFEHDFNLRKSAVIDRELSDRQVDISALQETRLLETGSIREKSYTFFWSGRPAGSPRQHGVGFAIKNSLVNIIHGPVAVSERICWLRLALRKSSLMIICVYAPTLYLPSEDKDTFYNQLSDLVSTVKQTDKLIVLGDFNARVGNDYDLWPDCIGKFGIGRINDNGQRALELCSRFQLCVTNTFFQLKDRHKVSWCHLRSLSWHQLDLVLTRRCDLNDFLITRSYHSADCDTDHALVMSKINIRSRLYHQAKKPGLPKINASKTRSAAAVASFNELLHTKLSSVGTNADVSSYWEQLKKSIHGAALDSFGLHKANSPDWFVENFDTLSPAIEQKRKALIALKENPDASHRAAYNKARRDSLKLSRYCVNNYYRTLCDRIESSAATGNLKAMYDDIKSVMGPCCKKTAPLKSKDGNPLTTVSEQLDRWIEHFSDLYGKESPYAREILSMLPDAEPLAYLDEEPDVHEIEYVLKQLKNGKAPGLDSISAEFLRVGRDVILPHLHTLLIKCWRSRTIPQDMINSNIITLYKNKGDRGDCNNYRGISLLSVIGKVIARVILSRLQIIAENVYPESQCGFRSGRGTVDMIFSLRQLQEKCREQQRPLHIAFVDLTKAFDLVNRDALFLVLRKVGCPPVLLDLIIAFHHEMKSTVQFEGNISQPFSVCSGVKQGCVLAPTLFGIFFSVLVKQAIANVPSLMVNTRFDANLFAPSRLRAVTKISSHHICETLYADDAAFCAYTAEDLQSIMDSFSQACTNFGLTISIKKTEILSCFSQEAVIHIHESALKNVDNFTYLGSSISSVNSLDHEINCRLGKAGTSFGRLTKRVFSNKRLTLRTKIKVYEACVLSILLYGSESWVTYRRQEHKLNSFHLRCLRNILQIKWQDKITNSEVLLHSGSIPLSAILKHRRLRWLGHVRRMSDTRLPKILLYGELSNAPRKVGRPHLRWKDVIKRDLKDFGFNPKTFETTAENRSSWRSATHAGLATDVENYHLNQAEKRRRRHQRSARR